MTFIHRSIIICSTFCLLLLVSSCSKIKGPRGLKQSEWVAWCASNPLSELCTIWTMEPDSLYISGLIFEKNSLMVYQIDSVWTGSVYNYGMSWTEIVPPGAELEISRDSIFIDDSGNFTTVLFYSLEDEVFVISSSNSELLHLEDNLVFTVVDFIPNNNESVVEL